MHPHNLFFFFFFFFFTISFAELCHPNDKKALLNIKKAFNNPHSFSSWKSGKDCCTWSYVACNSNHQVDFLDIAFDGKLSGQIPPFVGDLPFLTNLRFHGFPKLTGPIPPTIAKLHMLVSLDLSSNSLSGPIPSFLGSLSNLDFLDLSSNLFTGSIPASLANLPHLNGLHLNENKLTGPIPDSFGNFGGSNFIPPLYLSHNQLSGKIPASFGRASFHFIDFSWNKLEGDGSVIFGANKAVTDISINLSRNLLEFNMSKVVFPEGLNWLDVSHNKIFGEIPVEIAKLQMFYLNVSYNALCGRIPVGEWLDRFDASSYFHNKCLCGKPLDSCK